MFLTFKGTMPKYATITEIQAPIRAGVGWSTLNIPGRPGVLLMDKEVKPISIPVTFLVEGKDREEYLRNCEDFADWLDTDNVEPLVFSDNPQRTYYAVAQGEFQPEEELVIYSLITVEFFVPDGVKYGPEKSWVFYDGVAVVENKGSLPVKPIVYAEVLQDLTHLDVLTENKYMRIGQPAPEGLTVVPSTEDLILNAPMNNLTGWAYGGLLVDGGQAVGTFQTGDGEFYISSAGTGAMWHGPAAKQALTSGPLTDWRVEAHLKFKTETGKVGKFEVYLLSDTGAHIGKVAVVNTPNSLPARIEVRIGGGSVYKFLVVEHPANPIDRWKNFDGIIRLEKKGNEFKYYISHVNPSTGAHTGTPLQGRFLDSTNLYTGNLAQVQLFGGNYGTSPAAYVAVKDLKVWRLNNVPATDPRIIAKRGDMITLDFTKSAIYINGFERKELKDMFARFFKLPRGRNIVAIHPAASVNAVLLLREGYR